MAQTQHVPGANCVTSPLTGMHRHRHTCPAVPPEVLLHGQSPWTISWPASPGTAKIFGCCEKTRKTLAFLQDMASTIQHKPLWSAPLVTCTGVTSRLRPDNAHICRIQFTQAELAKFYSPGQIRPARGLAPKPARAFQRHGEGRAESGPAPRDPPASPQKGASLPRVNVILRYLCIAVANLSGWEQPAEQERAH